MMLSDDVLAKFTNTNAGNKAREFFTLNGFPKRKSADFHYFDIQKSLETEIIVSKESFELEKTTKFDLDISLYTDGIIIMEAIEKKPHIIKDFNPQIEEDALPIDLLVAGLASAGNTIILPENSEMTIRIRHGADTNKQLELVIGENSKITLVEEIFGDGGFGSCHFTIALKAGSKLEHLFFSENKKQICFIRHRIILHENANYSHNALWFGSKNIRHDVAAYLIEKNAKIQINGTYLIDKEKLDFSCFISHQEIECNSKVNVRGVVCNGGLAVFQGKINVVEDAQKTIGNMEHRAIMLEEGARINAKPCLEIYADDVECSHANTIGALDDKALFYMQSRGIPKAKAKSLLTIAFLEQVFDDVQDEDLKTGIISRIESKLGEMIK
jgi:Fe-S cluster assembly protein SufD